MRWFALLAFALPAVAADRTVTFERDVQPLLTRSGCNAGACHGKARGQNGFALSLLGFDPTFDHNAITKEGRGRRSVPFRPGEQSVAVEGERDGAARRGEEAAGRVAGVRDGEEVDCRRGTPYSG